MTDLSAVAPFANRLRKNAKRYVKWARSRGLTAFRLYDRDMPEFPYVVDWYDGRIHLEEYPRRKKLASGALEAERAQILEAVTEVLEVPPANIFVKTHLPQAWGRQQYGRQGKGGERFVVEEHGLKFWVNLSDYLDTGLFMDHRNTRQRVREEVGGKRFLNLFAYTGAFTVAAAAGGAKETVTVDLSGKYLDWAEDNLALNGLNGPGHRLIEADVLQWIALADEAPFDVIVLDPPSHSTSSRMKKSFEIQRDQKTLLPATLARLTTDGVLYFSTNYTRFELDPRAVEGFVAEELTPGSLPEDFQREEIHRCWRISR